MRLFWIIKRIDSRICSPKINQSITAIEKRTIRVLHCKFSIYELCHVNAHSSVQEMPLPRQQEIYPQRHIQT
jgi:hypothetical protein